MAFFRSSLLNIFQERGFIHQTTPIEELDAALASGSMPIYYGCDATASSLHVGNLIGLMGMRWVQETGHKAIMLIGGGTTKVGDPSGRDSTRKLLTHEQIIENMNGIVACYARILHASSMHVVDNAQWLDALGYTAFLRDIGVHFSVNRMLNFDSIKNRLERESPLSFIEFNYILLQSYDYLQLYRQYGCSLQVGGADQWGNIVSGVDLIRRIEGKRVHGLTWPLLETSRGAKMGKTANGAIWLDPERLKPYDYWQFWRNVDDADVVRFLKLFTLLPLKEIDYFTTIQGKELNAGKILLADHATAMIHGQAILSSIHNAINGHMGTEQEASMCSTYTFNDGDRITGIALYKILQALGWVDSGREGRQKIIEGAVKIDQVIVQDPMHLVIYHPGSTTLGSSICCGRKKTGKIIYQVKEN